MATNGTTLGPVDGTPLGITITAKKPKRGRAGRKMKRFVVLEEIETIEAPDRGAAVARVVKSFSLTRVFRIEEVEG